MDDPRITWIEVDGWPDVKVMAVEWGDHQQLTFWWVTEEPTWEEHGYERLV